MIDPINGHLLIKPLVHESFTVTQNETYQEIGEVIAIDPLLELDWKPVVSGHPYHRPRVGDKVYFDAWLAAKFPSDDPENPYWLVKYEDIRAYAKSE